MEYLETEENGTERYHSGCARVSVSPNPDGSLSVYATTGNCGWSKSATLPSREQVTTWIKYVGGIPWNAVV